MSLKRFTGWPKGLADVDISDLGSVLPGPSLIYIKGKQERPLFLSTLLHGNETTSFHVLQMLVKRYSTEPPPRSLMIFVGNIDGAEQGKRVLPGRKDMNRIWAPDELDDCPEKALAETVLAIARGANLFASIDIHNTTGRNPHYGCVNTLRAEDLALIEGFASIGVYYQNPSTTQSVAFSKLCPAITVECGQNDNQSGFEAALALVDRVMTMTGFDDINEPAFTGTLFETVGRVVLEETASGYPSIGFGTPGHDLVFDGDMQGLNFQQLDQNSLFAQRPENCNGSAAGLLVVDEQGHDLTNRFFKATAGEIRLNTAVTPAMITHDEAIIRQDCLCYLMKPIALQQF